MRVWLNDSEFQKNFDCFSTDPERSVRETAFRISAERRKRSAGSKCLSEILRVHEGKTQEILKAWKFGQALGRVGDDFCIRTIRECAGSGNLPRNVRHWLERINEGIEEGWRKATQKWPEPWLSWGRSHRGGTGSIDRSG